MWPEANPGLSGVCRERFRRHAMLESNVVFRGEKNLMPCVLTRMRAPLHSDPTEAPTTTFTRSGNNTHY